MAIAADTPVRPDGIQRGRGGFYRNALDVPYVTDPSGELVKSGERKGQPKRTPYSSTSGFGKLIENGGALEKWSERQVVHGIATGNVHELLDAYRRCDDDDIRRTIADEIVMRAKADARSSLAADRGTHAHTLTEHVDRGQPWGHLIADGEALGITREEQHGIVAAWQATLARYHLFVEAVEAAVVDDLWRCAGTLDRIVRLGRPLKWALGTGEVAELPAGTRLIGDIKTGSLRRVAAIQLASYAQSVPYDTEAETRGAWPWEIEQRYGLIFHLSIESGTCDLVCVDLAAGRIHGGEAVVRAKHWERLDVFSVAELTDFTSAPAPDVTPPEPEPASTAPAPVAPIEAEASGCKPMDQTATGTPDLASAPSATPFDSGPSAETPAREEAPPSRVTPADQQAAMRARPTPEEGTTVDDPTFDALQAHYVALPAEGRAWITALTSQAQQASVPFHTKGHRTRRRYEIVRALVHIAADGIDDTTEDTTRTFLEAVIGDVAQFPSVPLGHLIGSLSATEAATFAGLVDGTHRLAFTDEGRPTVRAAA